MQASFWKAGHPPTLFAAFLYFDVSFMVWVLLGPLGVQIAQTLQISPAEKGLMVATPVLAGAFLRVVLGLMVDRLGPKLTGIIGQIVVMAALAAAWLIGLTAFWQVMLLGIFLGVAGASFAVALPLASRWYPPEHQGTALGIAGAGNSGTVFAALFAPTLAAWYGWNSVFGLALIPLGIAFVLFLVMAKDSPDAPPPKSFKEYLAVLREVRRLVVHVLLQRDVRRLRRSGVLADHLLQRRLWHGTGGGRLLHGGLRLHGLGDAAGRRLSGGPHRRHQVAQHHVRHGGHVPDHRQLRAGAGLDGADRLRLRHAGAGHGQWRGVPAWCPSASGGRSAS